MSFRILRGALPRYISVLIAGLMLLLLGVAAFAGPKTQAGPYHIELTTDPGVIPVGKAKLQIRLTDASGKPVEGATLRALTKMPAMDMGERQQVSTARAGEPGVYDIPAQFAMEGGYESTLQISGPLGEATTRIPLQTGQDTSTAARSGPSLSPGLVIAVLAAIALLAFTLYRMWKTGQLGQIGGANFPGVEAKAVFNGQVLGGLVLLALITVGAVYAVGHLRRPGALTPVEAQAMDMSYLPPPPGYHPVELTTVTRGTLSQTVRYTGTAVGYVEQEIVPRVTGTLIWMPLYAGNSVRRGQVLARLDTSQTQPLLAQQAAAARTARQGISIAEAEREQAEAEVEQAHSELAGKQGAVAEARAQVETAREDQKNADAALASAQARIADATAELTAMKADQTYWQAQIKRSQALKEAGAISGEEYQKDKAQADTADAKVQQAEARLAQANADREAAQSVRRKADAQIVAANARVQMAQSELTAHSAHVRSAGAAVRVADQKIAQAQSETMQAQAGVQAASATRGYSEIRAESDGVVTQRLISPGVLVSPGQPILKVAQIQPLRLQAYVAEADLSRIQPGSPVTVQRQGEGTGSALAARITSVAPAVDPTSRTGLIEAIVTNADHRFLPGQYIVMDITTGERRDVLRLPTRAIAYHNTTTNGSQEIGQQPYVWVADPTGQSGQYTAHQMDVQVGISDGQTSEIIAGLTADQRVVLSGGTDLRDGDAIAEPHPVPSSPEPASNEPPLQANGKVAGDTGVPVQVTAQGFQPATVTVHAGAPARLVFTRTSDETCAKEVVFPDYGIKKALPLNQPIVIEFTPKRAGDIAFACGMNMFKGKVIAR